MLFATVLGSGIAFLDGTVVNVALPSIGREFHVGLADLQWTVTGYTLTLSALILLGGSLGDRYGRRRIFMIGLVWFTAASLLCGLAPSAPLLIAARGVQGVGGALLTPASLAIIEATFRQDDRGAAIGAWSGLGGIFGAIGPLLGGLLVGAVSWRLVFFINVPLAAITVAVAARHVPESLQPGQRGRLDVPGPVLVGLGLGGVTYGLIEASSSGWTSPVILTALGAGIAALGLFLLNERRQSDPLLPLDIFRIREFAGANAATFAIYGALGAVIFLVVIQVQQVLHYSPLAAGAALLPMTLILLALSSSSGRLASSIGPRIPMTVGPLIAGVGMALFTRVDAGATYVAAVLPAGIVFGLGMVITVPALTTTAMGAVGAERSGIASAINNDVARAASLAAVAVVPVLAGISTSGTAISSAAFSSGFRTAMFICAGLCAVGGVISLLTIGGRRRPAVEPQRAFCCPITGPPQYEVASRRSA